MLTDQDLDLIARADVYREPATMDVIRKRTGESATTLALLREIGHLRHLLGEVTDRLKEVGGA